MIPLPIPTSRVEQSLLKVVGVIRDKRKSIQGRLLQQTIATGEGGPYMIFIDGQDSYMIWQHKYNWGYRLNTYPGNTALAEFLDVIHFQLCKPVFTALVPRAVVSYRPLSRCRQQPESLQQIPGVQASSH